jgi:hypothetical protein
LLGNSRSKRATTRLTRFCCVDKVGPAGEGPAIVSDAMAAHVVAVKLRLACGLVAGGSRDESCCGIGKTKAEKA